MRHGQASEAAEDRRIVTHATARNRLVAIVKQTGAAGAGEVRGVRHLAHDLHGAVAEEAVCLDGEGAEGDAWTVVLGPVLCRLALLCLARCVALGCGGVWELAFLEGRDVGDVDGAVAGAGAAVPAFADDSRDVSAASRVVDGGRAHAVVPALNSCREAADAGEGVELPDGVVMACADEALQLGAVEVLNIA